MSSTAKEIRHAVLLLVFSAILLSPVVYIWTQAETMQHEETVAGQSAPRVTYIPKPKETYGPVRDYGEAKSLEVTPKKLSLGKISAKVVPVSTVGNELTPPSNPKTLGWWGVKAGAKAGVTLLVGHTVHTGGGALDDLEEVNKGTEVVVSGVHYVVKSNTVVSKKEFAQHAKELLTQDGFNKLVIVTCEDYNWKTGKYASNVVLTAYPKGI